MTRISLVLLVFLISCSHPAVKTTYNVTDWMAVVPTNVITWDAGIGWVKLVEFKDSVMKTWKLNSNGDTIWAITHVSDTAFLLRTADPKLPVIDSVTGKPRMDNGQEVFYLSWSNPLVVPKDVVKVIMRIPTRFIPGMYSAIPQVSDTVKKK